MKRKILILIMTLLLLTGCNKQENRKSVNILNWSSYIPDSVLIDFEKETGININYGTYSSNEECLAKVSNAKSGTYDLIFPSDYMVEIMISRNLLEKIDKNELKNINNINLEYMNLEYDPNNDYSLPFIAASTIISVNRDKIKDEINSYNDLLNPKYKNEIVLIDDQRIIIGMALLANGFDMNSTNKTELRIARDWLQRLKRNLKAFDSDSPKNFLISEEASIAVLWNAEGAIASIENNNIENIYPKEGIAISIDNFVIPKNAKNKDEAYIFIDYILRPDIMKKIINNYPYKNVNIETDKILDDTYIKNNASNIPNEIFNNGMFVKNIGDKIQLYDKIWAEIK
ncbi:MAG: spermidine/putrescine ABC transporter substrate-binding protein [Bacilli bacterium]|nr:spermidine/putrescine ABC transporter substrate-binding protein [Bacilli bacterium]